MPTTTRTAAFWHSLLNLFDLAGRGAGTPPMGAWGGR
jgi:hypothetical protein